MNKAAAPIVPLDGLAPRIVEPDGRRNGAVQGLTAWNVPDLQV